MRRLLSILAFSGLAAFQLVSAQTAFAADGDGDNVADEVDVCPEVADPFQGDLNGDGVGDLCAPGAAGVTTFDGTPSNDLVFGTAEADTLNGAGGNDALYGLEGDDTLDGGSGNDFLSGGPDTDTLTGGAGCDVFAFDPAGDDDVITDYNPAVDRMSFPAQGEESSSNPAANAVFGGDDHLVVTFKADGATATLDFEGLPAGVEIALNNQPCASPPVEPPVEEIPAPLPPEEPPFICAPLFDFEIFPPGFLGLEIPADGVLLFGTSADETLTGTHCSDFIVGDTEILIINPDSPEPDLTPLPECVDGLCGDDVIYGLAGNDLLVGDTETLLAGEIGGNDTIYGGQGGDLILGDALVMDGCECDALGNVGGLSQGPIGGNDTLYGNEGDDVIFGDTIGGIASDGTGGNDHIEGGEGDDLLVGDALFIVNNSTGGNDTLIGGAGDDYIYGDAMEVDGSSEAGDDTLIGGAGDDFLVGDAEFVDGDAAHDTFVYDASTDFGDDTIADAGNREVSDTISFTGAGLVDLVDLDARSTVTDDGVTFDVLAVVYTDSTKTTKVGSITIWGVGNGTIASWADLDLSALVDVVVVP